jgi:hypothetical protein
MMKRYRGHSCSVPARASSCMASSVVCDALSYSSYVCSGQAVLEGLFIGAGDKRPCRTITSSEMARNRKCCMRVPSSASQRVCMENATRAEPLLSVRAGQQRVRSYGLQSKQVRKAICIVNPSPASQNVGGKRMAGFTGYWKGTSCQGLFHRQDRAITLQGMILFPHEQSGFALWRSAQHTESAWSFQDS